MTTLEKEWIVKCQREPNKYKILVDNDAIFVEDLKTEEAIFYFDDYGYHFVKNLFAFLGCNVDYV